MGTGTPLWQWPLYSPKRLVGTLVILAVLIVGVAVLLNLSSEEGGRPQGVPAPGVSNSPVPRPSSPSAEPTRTPTPDYGAAIDTARQFVTAWARPEEESWKAWYAGVAPYATDDLAKRLSTVDHRNVPATKVTGKSRLTDTGGVGRTEVAVETDGGMVSVVIVQAGKDSWKVADFQPGAQAVE
ncbi:hypothetical protein QIS99_28830 [Streptomyces sp. B-S-A8]|uniref:DUF4878 domain-containing protein n=1 Tax=Streptomyces solicavernae TaxID=3043614 RepID=A0ABT6S0E0_9ACTN|nr:hypothetical protein [Streptomyces sp. B-S-A8]MDI3390166.1 hypothetical protein [Streptomyces sp. B-S-A8]